MKYIRSALFVPGNNPDRIKKAYSSQADAIIIDLEDSVPIDNKDDARKIAENEINITKIGTTIIRINPVGSNHFINDLKMTIRNSVRYIMVPKIEFKTHIDEIDANIRKINGEIGKNNQFLKIIPLIESANGIKNIFEILDYEKKPKRILTVAFGAADYTLDIGAEMTKDGIELNYPRSKMVIACRSANIKSPIDTPFMLDLKDIDGLKKDAIRAKRLGFQGKLCIHPNQIKVCNEVFSPSKEEIEFAKKIFANFSENERNGKGAIQIDGKFIDRPIVERYKRIYDFCKQIQS